MRILTLSGSLRAASLNSAVLEAARRLAPPGMELVPYLGLGQLPLFNPDLDGESALAPAPVAELRRMVGASDALLIACPEYAHGVPGPFKNALDWLVSCSKFPGKPVVLLNGSPRSTYAQAALAEVLQTMSARLLREAWFSVPLSGRETDAAAFAADAQLAPLLRAGLERLAAALKGTMPAPAFGGHG